MYAANVSMAENARAAQRGQMLVIVAFALTVLIGMLALVIDVGLLYVARRQSQNAADAGVAAASRLMALNSDGTLRDADVRAAVETLVETNGARVDWPGTYYISYGGQQVGLVGSGQIPESAAGLVVTASRPVQVLFSVIFGTHSMAAPARAAALAYNAQPPQFMTGLQPLAVPMTDYVRGASYNLWGPQFGQNLNLPANWKGLVDYSGLVGGYGDCGGNLNSCLNEWAAHGLPAPVGVGQTLSMATGNRTGYVAAGLTGNCLAQNHRDAGGAYGVYYVALFDSFNNTAGSVHVYSFAAFKTYCNTVGDNNLNGEFVSFISPGGLPGSGLGEPYGPMVVKLVDPENPATPAPTATPFGGGTGPATPIATPTPNSASPTPTPSPTSTPPVSATPTSTATPVPSQTATPTPAPGYRYTMEALPVTHLAPPVSYSTAFYCPAGKRIRSSAITWSSQAAVSLNFRILPAAAPAPSAAEMVAPPALSLYSGAKLNEQVSQTTYYYLWVYNPGNIDNRDAQVNAFELRCE